MSITRCNVRKGIGSLGTCAIHEFPGMATEGRTENLKVLPPRERCRRETPRGKPGIGDALDVERYENCALRLERGLCRDRGHRRAAGPGPRRMVRERSIGNGGFGSRSGSIVAIGCPDD